MIVDLGSWRKGTDTVTVPHHTTRSPYMNLSKFLTKVHTFYKRVFGYSRSDVKWDVSSMIETIDSFVHYCIVCTYRVQSIIILCSSLRGVRRNDKGLRGTGQPRILCRQCRRGNVWADAKDDGRLVSFSKTSICSSRLLSPNHLSSGMPACKDAVG